MVVLCWCPPPPSSPRFTTCSGCAGATDTAAGLSFVKRHFTVSDWCKPYTGYDWECSSWCTGSNGHVGQQPQYSLYGFRRLGSDPEEIRAAIREGPVLAGMAVYEDFNTYGAGVYHHISGKHVSNHAIELIGYGTDFDGTPYWIAKNSWGPHWGEGGYFRIAAGSNEVEIESSVIAAVLVESSYEVGEDFALAAPLGGFQEASPSEETVMEAAEFAAREVNPFCDDGKFDGDFEYNQTEFSVKEILSASQRVDGCKTLSILMEVSLPQCQPQMFVDVQVHLDLDGLYHLLSYRFVPQESVRMIRGSSAGVGGAVGGARACTMLMWGVAGLVLVVVWFRRPL